MNVYRLLWRTKSGLMLTRRDNFEYTKAVNIRRTDITMAKRNGTKGQAMIYKTLHRKRKVEQHEPN
jgi:hypothetical protein